MSFIITTSPIIENRTITEYLGPIISNEVLGVNVISDSIASFSDFFEALQEHIEVSWKILKEPCLMT